MAEISKLQMFRAAMYKSLQSVTGGVYGQLNDQHAIKKSEINNLLLRHGKVWEAVDNKLMDVREAELRVMNVRAQRRDVVFKTHLTKMHTGEYEALSVIEKRLAADVGGARHELAQLQGEARQLDDMILYKRKESNNAHAVLGEGGNGIHTRIAVIDRKLTTLGYRRSQLLRQIGGKSKRVVLRSSGSDMN
jgi:hypothetical protein